MQFVVIHSYGWYLRLFGHVVEKSTWPSHIRSLIIVSDLVPASLFLGSNFLNSNTSVKPSPNLILDFTKVSTHITCDLGNMPGTSGHHLTLPATARRGRCHSHQHLITVSHGCPQLRLTLCSSSPTMSTQFHSFLTVFPRFFLVDRLLYVYISLIHSYFRFFSHI